MDRFRFGLGGLGGPLTERTLYGDVPKAQRLSAYGRVFGCYEMNVSAGDPFTRDVAQAFVARAPPHLELIPRFCRRVGDEARLTGNEAALDDWLHAVEPILRCAHRGPVYVPWHGPRTPETEAELERLLSSLWPRLPARQRLAVEFRHASWFHPDPIHLLEEYGAGLVWSAVAGRVPYRATADFVYIRLTGVRNRHVPDEVQSFAQRVASRRDDERPIYVVSSLHHDPYGLQALERFARLVGRRLDWEAARQAPADTARAGEGQASLDGYAVMS